eukprot:TRINITY_DN27636_c0_g1_i1.p1 TRINITY_DN27636_c0_g1~~TRINITY_DN27636_c0_g1_i1.p1  ORF type:complete len:514 (+),score=89.04 TRINITY_DN27636_c0_g1_i1:51-1544(+)
MFRAVVLALFPLVALSACSQGGNCPTHVGQGLLQASMNSSRDTLATRVSSETAKRLLQGLQVDAADIGKYVESLAAKVTGHNYTMSNAETTALGIIEQLVGKMQNASDSQHAEDQQEVYRMRDLIQNCTSDAAASLAKVAALKETVKSTRSAHNSCRESEGVAKDDKDSACATYDSHRGTSSPPTCMSTELSAEYVKTDDGAKKKQMELCLEAVNSWLSPLYAKYEDCKSKTGVHKKKSADCGSQQHLLEQAFCTYESKLEETCDAQNSCRAQMIADRNSSHDSVKLAEAARKADFAASRRLLCFLDVLRANNTHKQETLQKCQNLNKQTVKFDIVYPGIPDAADCVPEQRKPCDDSWQVNEYKLQAWHAKAQMKACQSCPVPVTTMTSTTSTTNEKTTTSETTTTKQADKVYRYYLADADKLCPVMDKITSIDVCMTASAKLHGSGYCARTKGWAREHPEPFHASCYTNGCGHWNPIYKQRTNPPSGYQEICAPEV